MPHLMKSVSKMFKNQSKSKAELHLAAPMSSTTVRSSRTGMLRQITKAEISAPIVTALPHQLIGRAYDILQQQQPPPPLPSHLHRNVAQSNKIQMASNHQLLQQQQQHQQQPTNERKPRRKRSKRQIFGVPLLQLEPSRGKHTHVPRFVVDLIFYIERNFIRKEGLYRVSGSAADIANLKCALNENYDPKLFESADVNVLTSLLKLFFRELPESLIPPKACDLFHNKNSEQEIANELRKIFLDLPNPRGPTIRFLIKHFVHVANFSLENRMTAYNLATVWGPTLVWVENICEIPLTSQLLKTLIQSFSLIFSD